MHEPHEIKFKDGYSTNAEFIDMAVLGSDFIQFLYDYEKLRNRYLNNKLSYDDSEYLYHGILQTKEVKDLCNRIIDEFSAFEFEEKPSESIDYL